MKSIRKWFYGALLAAAVAMGGGMTSSAQEAKAPAKTTETEQGGATYRLVYTLTELDGTKRIGVQHFGMTITSTSKAVSVKLGSKVPVATGSFNQGSGAQQTQFTYIDVGLNIRAQLSAPAPNGLFTLDSQVEQSGVAETVTIATVNEPVIRQTRLENTAQMTLGKPVMLGSLDTPGSTRHLDVEVVMEAVK